jgi:predicted metal-dependent hydrolase
MEATKKPVTDPKVLDGLKRFSAQKGHHYRMHKKLNATIRRSGFPGLDAFERELSDDYQRFSRTKSLRFDLAYAEGFEAFTMNLVKHLMEPNGFGPDLAPHLEVFE